METNNTILELKPPFKVHICNKKALLWNTEEIRFLRENYRIVGSFIGCLPRYPLQNQLFGLPMILMHEEVTLLLSKGIIVLVDDEKSHQSPTQVQIEEFKEKSSQEESIQLQEYVKFIEEKKSKIESLRNNKISGQDVKGKRDDKFEKTTSSNDLKGKDVSFQQKQESQDQEDQENSSDLENKTLKVNGFTPVINIKTSSTSFAWYNDDGNCFNSINAAKQNNLWVWPSTSKDIQKYKIYCDLWNKGYYITSGVKFGGDYLLYPGDPLRYHSHYIATILDIDKIISPMDIITFGRLGTTVKKSYMLCSWNQQQDNAVYFCLEWSGFG